MKKLIALLLVLVTSVYFCGCTADGDGGDKSPETQAETPAIEETVAETLPETEAETQPQEIPGQTSLLEFKQRITDAGALFGVAYLGYIENDDTTVQAYLQNYSHKDQLLFLDFVPVEGRVVKAEGNELYVIVPADDTVKITVSQCELNVEDYTLEPSSQLFGAQDGLPLFLQGNISEIVPSFVVIAEKGDVLTQYTPYLSLKDGSLVCDTEGVLNITPEGVLPKA